MMSRIIPVLALIFAAVLFFGYVNPTHQGSIAEANAKIKSYQSALDASKRFAEKEAELTQERAALPQDGITRLEAFLPDGVNNVQLILDLTALAARSGIVLSNFAISEPADTSSSSGALALQAVKPVESLDISLSATGTYPQFRSFLRGVEQSLRPLDIVNVSVSGSATGTYTYTVVMRIYWLR